MSEINQFWAFCLEREQIRTKKELGELPPWTSDPILNRHNFTNINRIHDRGTELLIDAIKYYPDELKYAGATMYRFSGSNPSIATMLKTIPSNDWYQHVQKIKPLFKMSAYQANWPSGKGQGIKFMYNKLKPLHDLTWPKLKQNMDIPSVIKIMTDALQKLGYKAMRFQCTEIAKDLSIFTSIVDPDSVCPMNVGAIKGLQYIFKSSSKKNVSVLKTDPANPGYNEQILEHALCEYSKYRDYQTGVRKPHQKIYRKK